MAVITSIKRNQAGIDLVIPILKQRLGERLRAGKDIVRQHGHTTTWLTNQPPDAVAFVNDTAEVSALVSICNEHRVPVIPFGAGTSLEGHLNAPGGGISIDMSAMNKLIAVHAEDLDCVIQPGITRKELNGQLRDTGLFFPVDPGADASLGGMAATRASGTNAVRYGTMKDNVLSVEAVMPDGSVIRTGRRAKKSSAGYDLTRLLIGSEGTLGVITELSLRLCGIPEAISGGYCGFPDVDAACRTVIETIQYGIPVARIEILDADQVRACNAYSQLDLPETPMLFVEFHGSEQGVREQAQRFGEISGEHGGADFHWATREEDRNKLWQARHDAYWAVRNAYPGLYVFATDVCVPISNLAECVGTARADAAELGLVAPIVGHVGDGNFHMTVVIDRSDPEALARAETLVGCLARRAIEMDGTCTGEHGVGQGKMAYMEQEMGPALAVMSAIKSAIDPNNIMNPGKIIPAMAKA
ncbi:MAG: FAD-binding oxidoreductase [Alphaproteobacteria bacterium]